MSKLPHRHSERFFKGKGALLHKVVELGNETSCP